MNGFDKYIAVARKLRKRYAKKDGFVAVSHGPILSICGALDYAAFRKYVLNVSQKEGA